MKVIHVNYDGAGAGSAVACRRLHVALCKQGVDSEIWCVHSPSGRDGERFIRLHLFRDLSFKCHDWISKLVFQCNTIIPRSLNILPSRLLAKINTSDADVVHLHWVGGEIISIKQLGKIKKPVVWTQHDTWSFMGGEHIEVNERYLTGYEKAPRSSPECQRMRRDFLPYLKFGKKFFYYDVDRWVYERKVKHWRNWNPLLIAPCQWIGRCASQSMLFKNKSVCMIPNTLDTNVFRPFDKIEVRKQFGISLTKKIIAFGAFNTSFAYKGGDLLIASLKQLRNPSDYQIVIFGISDMKIEGFDVVSAGFIREEHRLAQLYNCADVVCVPSRQDNIPYICNESLACGVPVVSYDIGGLSDLIHHQKNGYLAKPFDTDDFARGIEWILNEADSKALSTYARNRICNHFSEEIVAKQHCEAYAQICKSATRPSHVENGSNALKC